MVEIIRYTVISIFDLYVKRGKQLFAMSFKVAILVSVYSALLAGALMLFAGSVYSKGTQYSGIESLLYDTILNTHWSSLIGYISIITFSLFGLFLKRIEEVDFYGHGNVWDSLQAIDKKTYAELTVLFCISYLLCFWAESWLYSPADEGYTGVLDYLSTGPGRNIGKDFKQWVLDFAAMAGSYTPAVLGALIIARNFTNLNYTKLIRVYKQAFVAAVLLLFVALAIEIQARVWLQKYVVELLTLPFGNSITLSAFTAFVLIVVGAFFLPALAGTMLYPVQYVFESLPVELQAAYTTRNELPLTTENTPLEEDEPQQEPLSPNSETDDEQAV